MPFFQWRGVGLDGEIRSGRAFSENILALEQLLLQREIGLIDYHDLELVDPDQIKLPSTAQQLQFFRELLVLLDAGLQLPRALNFLGDQLADDRLQILVLILAHDVQRGLKFSQALARYPQYFSILIQQLIMAGENSGHLADALRYLVAYLENWRELQQKLRSALLMPLITLIIFLVITLFIFLAIIPMFATIFTAAGQQLHATTQIILAASNFLRSRQVLWLLIGPLTAYLIFNVSYQTKLGRASWDNLKLWLPVGGVFARYTALLHFWQTLALLARGNLPFPEAFKLAVSVVQNSILAQKLTKVALLIEQGFSLSQALESESQLLLPEVLAVIGAGAESGDLVVMSERVALIYNQRLAQLLKFTLGVLQPALVIILGLLVALLILAVYLPMFELPNLVVI